MVRERITWSCYFARVPRVVRTAPLEHRRRKGECQLHITNQTRSARGTVALAEINPASAIFETGATFQGQLAPLLSPEKKAPVALQPSLVRKADWGTDRLTQFGPSDACTTNLDNPSKKPTTASLHNRAHVTYKFISHSTKGGRKEREKK